MTPCLEYICKEGVNLILYFVVIIIDISFSKATNGCNLESIPASILCIIHHIIFLSVNMAPHNSFRTSHNQLLYKRNLIIFFIYRYVLGLSNPVIV